MARQLTSGGSVLVTAIRYILGHHITNPAFSQALSELIHNHLLLAACLDARRWRYLPTSPATHFNAFR